MRIAEVLRVAVVIGGVIAAAGSATSGRSVDECKPGQVCGFQPVPAFTRNHTVKTETPVDGIEIVAKQDAVTSWDLLIRNTTSEPVRVLWDDSSFVASTTESMGRLIRGETRKIDTEKPQTPTPIAPGASITQFVLVEKFISAEEFEIGLKGTDARQLDLIKLQSMRDARNKLITGGKLYVVVDTSGGKKTWSGIVESQDSAPQR